MALVAWLRKLFGNSAARERDAECQAHVQDLLRIGKDISIIRAPGKKKWNVANSGFLRPGAGYGRPGESGEVLQPDEGTRAIGKRLNVMGSLDMMLKAHAQICHELGPTIGEELSLAWDAVGHWKHGPPSPCVGSAATLAVQTAIDAQRELPGKIERPLRQILAQWLQHPGSRAFVSQHIETHAPALADLAAGKIIHAVRDRKQHSASFAKPELFFVNVTVIPVPQRNARMWFEKEYGAYIPYLDGLRNHLLTLNQEFKVLVHFVFSLEDDDTVRVTGSLLSGGPAHAAYLSKWWIAEPCLADSERTWVLER
jgi:hypothetical protein